MPQPEIINTKKAIDVKNSIIENKQTKLSFNSHHSNLTSPKKSLVPIAMRTTQVDICDESDGKMIVPESCKLNSNAKMDQSCNFVN